MLEIKDLKKIYKTKKGAAVHALDGVSLRFPETGMVFLLGKSGSGKSTLLNVCGGLDSPTEGEVIVKGRSSKSFSGSDFDSYRNTFIGFIFQEYNILNEFSVEDNIALALELQGKPKDKAAIAALLEEVDLTGYAKRKPNTLSGGQKQRIAIARALVKKPEIIMADEPTGALDSNTGKQVFDTLKKLSRNKLVIVVSHDRDFAEQYADRIIELKDGKVISDISKGHAVAQELSPNMNRMGDVLCIKKGAELSENDFAQIKQFLQQADHDVVIASDEKSVKTFKSAAKITDDGQMEVFRDTDPETAPKKAYTKEDSRFIRSRLPIRHAFRIGVSGIRNKPIRLFFTVLLCSVAFVLFGLLSTMSFYNSEATFRQTLQDAQLTLLQLTKDYSAQVTWYTNGEPEHTYNSYYPGKFSPAALERHAAALCPDAFGGVYCYSGFNLRQMEGYYWENAVTAMVFLPENNALRNQITGSYPKAKGEIVLSSYFAQMLVACKVYAPDGSTIELDAPADIIGKTISLEGREYKVTGILDSGIIPEEYTVLKEGLTDDRMSLYQKYLTHLRSGLHQLCFSSYEEVKELSSRYGDYKESRDQYMQICTAIEHDDQFKMPDYAEFTYQGISAFGQNRQVYTLTGDGKTLQDDQVIVPVRQFVFMANDFYYMLYEEAYRNEDYEKAEYYQTVINKLWQLDMGGIYEEGADGKEGALIPFTDEEYDALLKALIQQITKDKFDLQLGVQLFNQNAQAHIGQIHAFTVVGVYKTDPNAYGSACYFADAVVQRLWDEQKVTIPNYPETQTNYVPEPGEVYSVIFLPGNVPEEKMDMYWQLYNNEDFDENDSRLRLAGGFVDSLRNVDSMVLSLSQIFLYVGLVLAIFAALLLSNFISVSISGKKREIGILRAVGARSIDVFKIFFSESFVIGLICVAISAGTCMLLSDTLNQEFAPDLGASIFVFGPLSIGVLIGIAAVTILIATFLPVYNAAKKKPVDSIRAI